MALGSLEMTHDLAAYDDLFASRVSEEEWARIVRFRAYPAFLDGVRRHEGIMQPFFSDNLILNKVVAEAWRFQILVFTLYLHDTRDSNDPRTGLTFTNLRDICIKLGLASPGRVFAFLNLMKLGDYLTSVRSALDSRIVHLEPTPRFLVTVEEWNDGIFASIDAAHPDERLTELRAVYPDLGRAMRTSGAEGLLAGWDPLAAFPEVTHFAAVDGGWLLMEHVVAETLRQNAGGRTEHVSLNLNAVSTRFGGSRSNLRRMLESAYSLGLLEVPPQNGKRIVFSPRMICAFLTFMASFLGYFQTHSHIALSRVRNPGVNNPELQCGVTVS